MAALRLMKNNSALITATLPTGNIRALSGVAQSYEEYSALTAATLPTGNIRVLSGSALTTATLSPATLRI